MPGLVLGEDQRHRCWWPGTDPQYLKYHDEEWGRPMRDDHRLFEKICLEGFQAGLSWITILRKRDHFRKAFHDFDPEEVSQFGRAEVARLLRNDRIVRHRGKIESTINNARRALALAEEYGSLSNYFWGWEPSAADRPKSLTMRAVKAMSTSRQSTALSKDLKKRGWTFVGPTTIYAFMQAMGLVNDHLEGCFAREEANRARAALRDAHA